MEDKVIDVEPLESESVERKSMIDEFAEMAGAAFGEALNKADDAKNSFHDAVEKANLEEKATDATRKAEEAITSMVDSFTKGYSSKR